MTQFCHGISLTCPTESSVSYSMACSQTHFTFHFGVPQGSCLGPVLFTQYASSLFSIFNKHSVCAHAYADDHQLYTDFSPNQDSLNEAVTRTESCLQDVKSWMISNETQNE